MGNIDVINLMSLYYESLKSGNEDEFNSAKYLKDHLQTYLSQAPAGCTDNANQGYGSKLQADQQQPLIIMIDDLSSLLTTGSTCADVVSLISSLDCLMRKQSKTLQHDRCNLLVVQTTVACVKPKISFSSRESQLRQLVMHLKNSCDLFIALRPLETGHSTRVDGTVRIFDNRLPTRESKLAASAPSTSGLSLLGETPVSIGTNKAFFFKLSDRRVRLTTSALIF